MITIGQTVSRRLQVSIATRYNGGADLQVEARCGSIAAKVTTEDSLAYGYLAPFVTSLETMHANLVGSAQYVSDRLRIDAQFGKRGDIRWAITIHGGETYSDKLTFEIEDDQSSLPSIIAAARALAIDLGYRL